MRGSSQTSGLVTAILSAAGFVAVWAAAAALIGQPQRLPSPAVVAAVMADEAASGRLWLHLGATLARVAAAFVLALSIGAALGLALGRMPRLDRWLNAWVVIFLNLPALVVIVLCYIWLGLNEVAAVLAVAINKIPMVTVMLREGARALSPALDDMARAFRMSPGARLRHVVIPQLAPHLASAARAGLALIWKIVLVVEFLGRSNGVGFQIHLAFSMFRVAEVLAYALAFVAVMLAVEYAVLRPIEARANRWRHDP
ncbi:ABC transporter permease [Paracoccus sp. p4-l81]|uniref:ABC transporter permease n=1 Tax=unclassified Paracoccus (in: a-proteobacteria) TaxID=2688777 RepID=UPI0035B8FB7B